MFFFLDFSLIFQNLFSAVAVQYLRIITGCGSSGLGKSMLKQSVWSCSLVIYLYMCK